MQQASVGGCDEDSSAASPPATRSPADFAIKSEPVVDRNDGGVRVKVEMPEPTEAGSVEVKGEPREDYQRQLNSNDGYHYERNDKKPGYTIPDAPGQCQQPHQGYRPVALPHNSFGFPPFYGHHHPAMMPASFPAGRPSPDGPPIGKLGDAHEQAAITTASHVDRHVAAYGRMPPPIPNDGFLQEHHHRYDAGDFQHAGHGVPYPGFRPTISRSPYGNHQNNSGYSGRSGSGHYHQARQRKWSSAAFRGLHPPMPVSLLHAYRLLRACYCDYAHAIMHARERLFFSYSSGERSACGRAKRSYHLIAVALGVVSDIRFYQHFLLILGNTQLLIGYA